jgi:3-phosphoshikimate 1-carboxyvinyltransferase
LVSHLSRKDALAILLKRGSLKKQSIGFLIAMSVLSIQPSKLQGNLSLPPSKSHTMRALLFGALGRGKSLLSNYLHSPDVFRMIQALKFLGANIKICSDSLLEIQGTKGKILPTLQGIDAGNSGQILRFIGSLAALCPAYTFIGGDDSLCSQRPVTPLLSALRQLGAFAVSSQDNERAPILIRGPMRPGKAFLEGQDSQPVSGLLMATSFLEGTTQLYVQNPGEKPWIDLTLFWLQKVGGAVHHRDYSFYEISGPLGYEGIDVTIPADLSSAAFPFVAALVTQSRLEMENVDWEDIQGDKKILIHLRQMGANFSLSPGRTRIFPSSLRGIEIDVNDCIDAIPILAVLGCFASGKTVLKGGSIARYKESDRLRCMATELSKMGGRIQETEDGLVIWNSSLKGASLQSSADHRVAMALTIAALGAQGNSTLSDSDCIAKSYPSFISDFKRLGARIA